MIKYHWKTTVVKLDFSNLKDSIDSNLEASRMLVSEPIKVSDWLIELDLRAVFEIKKYAFINFTGLDVIGPNICNDHISTFIASINDSFIKTEVFCFGYEI